MKNPIKSINPIKTIFFLVVIIFGLFAIIPNIVLTQAQENSTTPYPIIDGKWDDNAWPSPMSLQTDNGKVIQFAYRVNQTHLFVIAKYDDSTPTLFNNSSPFQGRDYFAVGFDRNGDKVNMGTSASPDDAMFIGMEGNYSEDLFMTGIRAGSVHRDTDVGGTNDTYGKFTLTDNTFVFEAVKVLNSGDTKGYDIANSYGDTITIMIAFWNNLPVLTEISEYTPFTSIVLKDPFETTNQGMLTDSDLLLFILLFVVLAIFGGFYSFKNRK